ncbi:MAG: hypothetical protein B7Z02_14855 [Rhodobacterales bacterium 32-67-9]|nr:MAG: hypothetical protein B7Z02_14855 [Rhodobacterales bacterium 32-67-9]
MASDQRKSFAERLSRIGPDAGEAPRRAPRERSRRREVLENLRYVLAIPCAFLLAVLAGMFSRFVAFQVVWGASTAHTAAPRLAVVSVGGGAQAYAEIILGFIVAFILSQLFRLTRRDLNSVQIPGVFVGLGLVHNIAFVAPGPAALIFSREWVSAVHILFQDYTYAFLGFFLTIAMR